MRPARVEPRAGLPALLLVCLVAAVPACKAPRSGEPSSPAAAAGPVAEARQLIEAGRPDEALGRLQAVAADPEALYWQGVAWARKAETAPLPTPPPPPPDAPRGAPAPRAPELKPEELKALELFDAAARSGAQAAAAHLAAAELLAPHALHHFDLAALGRSKRPARGAPAAAMPAPGEPDWSVDGVLGRYRQAADAETSGTRAAEALIAFALRVNRPEEADAGFRALQRRDAESADPLVRYGDFLRDVRKKPLEAVAQYQQALIWRPRDAATRAKVADVYIELGIAHFERHEYMPAQVRFDEAAKYVEDKNSPQGLRLRDYLGRLREIRGGR